MTCQWPGAASSFSATTAILGPRRTSTIAGAAALGQAAQGRVPEAVLHAHHLWVHAAGVNRRGYSTLPGFMTPVGSSARLIARITSVASPSSLTR